MAFQSPERDEYGNPIIRRRGSYHKPTIANGTRTNRFTNALDCEDDRVDFWGQTGTFTGRNLAPPRKAGGAFQTNILSFSGTEDADFDVTYGSHDTDEEGDMSFYTSSKGD